MARGPRIPDGLKAILDRYGIDASDTKQCWDCHGTLVLYHRAYEIIAAREGIRFDPPTIIEGSSEKKTVALLVVGHMGERIEWSIGEAAPGNNKNSYPYAMAEKRAKDRVIAKLAGLAQYVYSEDEADEFKEGPRTPVAVPDAAPPAPPADPVKPYAIRVPATPNGSDWVTWGKLYTGHMRAIRNVNEGYAWIDANAPALATCDKEAPKIAARIKEITKQAMDAVEAATPDKGKAAA